MDPSERTIVKFWHKLSCNPEELDLKIGNNFQINEKVQLIKYWLDPSDHIHRP